MIPCMSWYTEGLARDLGCAGCSCPNPTHDACCSGEGRYQAWHLLTSLKPWVSVRINLAYRSTGKTLSELDGLKERI
jgi:hypothetical protein